MNSLIEQAVPHNAIQKIDLYFSSEIAANLRYDRFRVRETPQEWINLLGLDVAGTTHPKTTAIITDAFIQHNAKAGFTLSEKDEILLRTAPWVHDWGEARIDGGGVGDISFDQKTN